MKKYTTPIFESIYFELDSKIMDEPIPTEKGGDIVTNPWDDEFESGSRFDGLTLKA